ncbi:hypothetical protein [Flavobacterium piscinae]|uniref:hypothetical protein n=1 Tax=Flavobacterium piscinae TaxID=2506424 RepID=UPI002AAA67E9|nr:hypothetical protein [Flavobacterium piscinae]
MIKENFSEKKRFITCGLLLLVLTLTFLKPKGIFDFERLESSNILEAQSEGAANCTTVIKLKKITRSINGLSALAYQKSKAILFFKMIPFILKIFN